MSFFDSIPQAPRQQPRRPFWARSDAVIPGSVAAEVLLIRTEQVAVAVGSVRAYPNGFQFTLHGRLRHPDEAAGRGGADPFHRDARALDAQAPGDVLRLGLLYADGRRTATTAGHVVPDDGADGLLLRQEGGGGSNRGWDWYFWVYPLPPDGPVTVVASWLKHGVAETRAELDGTAILAASRRAVILWPDQAEGDVSRSWRSGKITPWSP